MKPAVSVIIQTYNRSEMLTEALESVFSQTFKDFEVFVIDDGSTDNTFKVVNKIRDVRLFYIFIKNSGVSAARNVGIKLTRGQYIALLDSDDIWLPEKLEKHVNFMKKNPDCMISQTEEIWIRNGKRVNPKKKHAKGQGDIFEKSLQLCVISPSAVMLKKELFEETGLFDESFPVCEDYDLWLRVTKNHNVLLLDEKLTIKRGGHEDQLSNSGWGFDIYRIKAIEKIINMNDLSHDKKNTAIHHLKEKCKILENGFRKRNKIEEADYFRNLYLKYR